MIGSLSQRVSRTAGAAALLACLTGLSGAAVACAVMLVASGSPNVPRQQADAGQRLDASLLTSHSKVVIAWDQKPGASGELGKVALTIAVNYHGEPKEFAAVVPVPTFIKRKQIGIVDAAAIDEVDFITEPHTFTIFDQNPCPTGQPEVAVGARARGVAAPGARQAANGPPPAVTVEANYDVAEYDVSILSAADSKGLLEWLNGHGYKLPAGAEAVLATYISQGTHFFVAKVNLSRMPLLPGGFLRPLQVRYEARNLSLPIRLGMVNANGPQDLVIFTLSRSGRVGVTNYPTVEMPTGIAVPSYVQGRDEEVRFYNAVFDHVVGSNKPSAYLEADHRFETLGSRIVSGDDRLWGFITGQQLIDLGARWIVDEESDKSLPTRREVILTRLHIRYDAAHFPEDLKFAETNNHSYFQAQYIVHPAWSGDLSCSAGVAYRHSLPERYAQEAHNLAGLTGWPEDEIRTHMAATGEAVPQ